MASSDWTQVTSMQCIKCKTVGKIWYRIVESYDGAFEDENLYCRECGHDWWIDGPDA